MFTPMIDEGLQAQPGADADSQVSLEEIVRASKALQRPV